MLKMCVSNLRQRIIKMLLFLSNTCQKFCILNWHGRYHQYLIKNIYISIYLISSCTFTKILTKMWFYVTSSMYSCGSYRVKAVEISIFFCDTVNLLHICERMLAHPAMTQSLMFAGILPYSSSTALHSFYWAVEVNFESLFTMAFIFLDIHLHLKMS